MRAYISPRKQRSADDIFVQCRGAIYRAEIIGDSQTSAKERRNDRYRSSLLYLPKKICRNSALSFLYSSAEGLSMKILLAVILSASLIGG